MTSRASARLEDVDRRLLSSAGGRTLPGHRFRGNVVVVRSCGCSRSPAAARSALSSTAPCQRRQPERPGQRPVLLAAARSAAAGSGPPRRRRWLTWRWARANRSSWFPGHRPGDLGQALLGVRGGDPGQRPHLGVRQPGRGELGRGSPAGPAAPGRPGRAPGRYPEDIWHFHDSHAAQLVMSQLAQPRRASKSASSTRNRHVAAVRCPASSQICASSRSSGTGAGTGAGAGAGRRTGVRDFRTGVGDFRTGSGTCPGPAAAAWLSSRPEPGTKPGSGDEGRGAGIGDEGRGAGISTRPLCIEHKFDVSVRV